MQLFSQLLPDKDATFHCNFYGTFSQFDQNFCDTRDKVSARTTLIRDQLNMRGGTAGTDLIATFSDLFTFYLFIVINSFLAQLFFFCKMNAIISVFSAKKLALVILLAYVELKNQVLRRSTAILLYSRLLYVDCTLCKA